MGFSMTRPRGWIVPVLYRFHLSGCPGPNGLPVNKRL